MLASVKNLSPEVHEAIARFAVKIVDEPLTYFSEADCQQLLVEELRKVRGFNAHPNTSVRRGQDAKETYKVPLIHREYGGGEKTRIDVVVFDPSDVRKIDNAEMKIGKQYLKPAYAFELGTEKTRDAAKHVNKDLARVKRAQHGYILHFFRDDTMSRTNTTRRAQTEARIERVFKEPLAVAYEQRDKVHILGVLIRVGRKQSKMLGKCRILHNGEWHKVNVGKKSELRRAILQALTSS